MTFAPQVAPTGCAEQVHAAHVRPSSKLVALGATGCALGYAAGHAGAGSPFAIGCRMHAPCGALGVLAMHTCAPEHPPPTRAPPHTRESFAKDGAVRDGTPPPDASAQAPPLAAGALTLQLSNGERRIGAAAAAHAESIDSCEKGDTVHVDA